MSYKKVIAVKLMNLQLEIEGVLVEEKDDISPEMNDSLTEVMLEIDEVIQLVLSQIEE